MLVAAWTNSRRPGSPVVRSTSEWKELSDGNEEKDTAPGADRRRGNRRRRCSSPREQTAAEQADDQAPAEEEQDEPQYAPAPADPTDQIEHLAKLHESGALTDEEFAAAKAKALGI